MRNFQTRLLGLALAALFLAGCAAPPRLTRLDEVSSDEAIAIAKFRVIYNGTDVTRKCCVIFNAPAFGSPKYQYILDEGGYLYAKLPVGHNSISFIIHSSKQHHFRSEDLTCHVNGGGAINYLGDITMDWQGIGSGSAFSIMVVGGPIAQALGTQGRLAVTVETNIVAAQEMFRQKFPTDRSLTPSLFVVKTRQ